jgi:hypothetical protein
MIPQREPSQEEIELIRRYKNICGIAPAFSAIIFDFEENIRAVFQLLAAKEAIIATKDARIRELEETLKARKEIAKEKSQE